MIDPDGFRPLPLSVPQDDAIAASRAEAEALLAGANRMHHESEAKATRVVEEAVDIRDRMIADARTDADRIRAAAKAESEAREKKADDLDTWAARAIIAGAVGLTASGEYELAKMVGFEPLVAWLLPFVIDVYVIQAFRRHRDVIQAIILTIAANVAYHLADARLFGLTPTAKPTWWLIALVASVASLILWRVHLMTAPPKPARTRRKDRQKQPVPAPVAAASPAPEPPPVGDVPVAKKERQEPVPAAAKKPPTPNAKNTAPVAKRAAQPRRQPAAKKAANKRRPMGEWVADAGPVFHAEFARLRRNPTADEFADAIAKAGLGKVSPSTAKNIRTEILDRAELPDLDGAE